jgi:hypothetical protein
MTEQVKDPFSFLETIDEKRKPYAEEVIAKSRKLGIDPRLSLALTYRESKFDPNAVGEDGEIGLMQVLPSTGKMMGYSLKDLQNPSKNIDAGLQYLNQNLIKFTDPKTKLPDPYLAVAGYNAGSDHPYFSDPTKPLPQRTVNYVRDIQNLGGFVTTPLEDTSAGTDSGSGSPPPPTPASEEDLRKQKAAMIGGLGGFAAGATQTMFGSGGQGPATTNANTPGGRYAAKTGYGIGEGSTKEVIDRYKKFAPQPLGDQMFADPKKSSMGAGPRNLPVVPGTTAALSINRQVPTPPPTPMLQNIRQGAQTVGNVMGKIPVVPATLGGASTGYQGQEAFNRYQKGDMTGATIAGVGALGGLASMVPHPATRALGATASAVSPAALAVLDKMRTMNQPPQNPASPQELQNAQNPAFRYPKPMSQAPFQPKLPPLGTVPPSTIIGN